MTDRVARLNAALEGRYSVEAEVGEGGMATVYLAEDLRHHRKVALKVLRPELAAVVGAERFLAEIETTASLQHPHILPLFDSGEADGSLFYVMPYLKEESLRERLDREHQLPVDEAVGIATDVAEALDYAHRRGVIHRDIKPANVLMLDGKPVVSDFGIALAVGVAGGGRLTETGVSLGTPHYMSPEQATGDQSVGPATDVYALGCVLYEMLVGEVPHTGSTPQAILGRVIAGEVPSASRERSSVPAHVDAALRKALEKLPADRFTGAQEFAKALADPGFRHGGELDAAAPGSRGKGLTVGFAALAGVLAVALGWALLRPAREPPPLAVERFRLGIGFQSIPTVLPDGSGVVYAEGGRLMLRRWADLTPTPIPGTEGVAGTASPVVSPAGDEVAFVVADGRLKVAPLARGVVRTLADSAYCCTRWGPDGFIYYSALARNIDRVPANGGVVETVTEVGPGASQGEFQVLAGGAVGVFTVWGDTAHIVAIRLATGERKVLTPGAVSYVTSAGYLVFGSEQGQILAAPFDVDALEVTGPPVPLVGGLLVARGYPVYSLSANGTLVYFAGTGGLHFVWATRSGQLAPVGGSQSFQLDSNNPGWRLSPDGGRIAFARNVNGNDDIWIEELPDGPVSRVTFTDTPDLVPEWAPDGQSITYRSGPLGEGGLWSKRADGTGEARLLFDGFDVSKGVWSPDGKWLVLQRAGTAGDPAARDILGVRPGVDTAAIPLVATGSVEQAPAISRDGRWLAYSSNQTGRDEIFVRPFPNVDDGQWQVSTEGGIQPVWAHNGRELFFVNPVTREVKAAEFTTTTGTFRRGPVTTLFTVPSGTYVSEDGSAAFYDVSQDDSRFLMAGTTGSTAPEAILVQNFFDEMEARVAR